MAHFSMHLNPFLFPSSVGVIFVALLFFVPEEEGFPLLCGQMTQTQGLLGVLCQGLAEL